MLLASLSIVGLSLVTTAAAQSNSQGICPEPFQITSTAGTLYSKQDGTQFPGDAGLGYQPTEFQLTSDGSLMTTSGVACVFTPWLMCSNSMDFRSRIVLNATNGAMTLFGNGSPGAASSYNHTDSDIFYACTAEGLGNQNIPASVTATSSSATATNQAVGASTIPELYILPAYLTADTAKTSSGCKTVGLQASRCFPNNATYSAPGPVASYSANAAADSHLGSAAASACGLAVLLGAFMA